MKILLVAIASALVFMISSSVTAKDSAETASNAINCSGLFLILTSVGEANPNFSQSMMNLQGTMDFFYAKHIESEMSKRVSRGMVNSAKSIAAKDLGVKYDNDPITVINLFKFCNAWRAEYAPYFLKNSSNSETEMTQTILAMPSAKKQAAATSEEIEKIKPIITFAFNKWDEINRLTPADARAILKEKAANNGPVK